MIDYRTEDLLPLAQAARKWPGGSVHVSTLHRYRLQGVRNVHLECIRVGGPWNTSWQAIDRFLERLNADCAEAQLPEIVTSKTARMTLAEKELERAGL